MTERDFEDFAERVREHDDFVAFVEAWWPVLHPDDVLARLRSPDALARYAKGVLRREEVRLLADSFAGSGASSGAGADHTRTQADVSVSDVPLIDEIAAQLGPAPPPLRPEEPESYEGVFDEFVGEVRTVADRLGSDDGSTAGEEGTRAVAVAGPPEQYDRYAHVLVDEAQDLSPMQWRMLGRRGERASWTIVGDPVQSSWPDPAEAEKARDTALGKRPRRSFRLSTNYRNSAEIFELAHQVIAPHVPEVDLPKAVRATGVEPEQITVGPTRAAAELPAAFGRALGDLLAEVDGTVGVVAAVDRLEQVRAWVDGPNGELGEDLAGDAADRVSVLAPLATKGLEYDGVLVVEPAEIVEENEAGTRTLYVVLTRATQRLTTLATREWEGAGGRER